MIREKRGQVWVETVIYTLIGLAIIGLVLAVAKPKIDQIKDEIVIEQSMEALSNMNSKIEEVLSAQGNQRVIDLEVGKGVLLIDAGNDRISWVIDSSFEYSEEGTVIPLGVLNVTTVNEQGQGWQVKVEKDYGSLDLQFGEKTEGTHQISAAKNSYRVVVENEGTNTDSGKTIVKIRLA